MATVRAKIVDAYNGQGLDSASVEVVNAKGAYLGQGVKTDNTGKFSFTSSIVGGNYLLITYQGMDPAMVEADKYTGSTYKEIALFPKSLDAVTVYPKKFPWWIVIVGSIGFGIAMLTKKKKKKNG